MQPPIIEKEGQMRVLLSTAAIVAGLSVSSTTAFAGICNQVFSVGNGVYSVRGCRTGPDELLKMFIVSNPQLDIVAFSCMGPMSAPLCTILTRPRS